MKLIKEKIRAHAEYQKELVRTGKFIGEDYDKWVERQAKLIAQQKIISDQNPKIIGVYYCGAKTPAGKLSVYYIGRAIGDGDVWRAWDLARYHDPEVQDGHAGPAHHFA